MGVGGPPGPFGEDDLLPIRALADLVFCERRAALHLIEGIWADNLYTVEGTHLHQGVTDLDPVESRGEVRIARSLRLRSLGLGLTGVADVVEFHRIDNLEEDLREEKRTVCLRGVKGLWTPFPIEYKHGRLRREEGYEVQLCAQALCLEEMMNTQISVGAVFYGKPRRRLEVPFTDELRQSTSDAAMRLHHLVGQRTTPRARYEAKCESCSLLDQCLPKALSSRHTVRQYLEDALAGVLRDDGREPT